jgi:hypothetical protein
MTPAQVKDLLTEAQVSLSRIGTTRELSGDKPLIANILRVFAGESTKLAVRKQINEPKVIIDVPLDFVAKMRSVFDSDRPIVRRKTGT